MIQFNYDFFDTLATTGERAVLGVVQTLANKGDLAGLREFMSYSSRNAESAAHTLLNEIDLSP